MEDWLLIVNEDKKQRDILFDELVKRKSFNSAHRYKNIPAMKFYGTPEQITRTYKYYATIKAKGDIKIGDILVMDNRDLIPN